MMSNPRFPHTCTISKSVGDVQLGTATETLVYSGSCRKELNNFNDQNPANAANTAQWLLSMPVVLRLEYGIKVVVDDGVAEIEELSLIGRLLILSITIPKVLSFKTVAGMLQVLVVLLLWGCTFL